MQAAFSALALPRGIWRFRSQGLGWADSLAFALIEKASHLCFESGVLTGRIRLTRRLKTASHG